MAKKIEQTDEAQMQEKFERERLERASQQMLSTTLVSKENRVQATYGHVKRKLEKLTPKSGNNRGNNG